MARITVEDCLDHVDNRFELVIVGSKRARQLATGGKEPMIAAGNDKPTVIALREIEKGVVNASILNQPEEETIELTLTPTADNSTNTESPAKNPSTSAN